MLNWFDKYTIATLVSVNFLLLPFRALLANRISLPVLNIIIIVPQIIMVAGWIKRLADR